MPAGADSVDGHPDVTAYLAVMNQDGEFVLLQGIDAGDYASIASDSPGLRIARVEQAVVNNTTEEFTLTVDIDGNDLPAKMNIKALVVVPHNGAATPAAVSTRFQLQIYTHSNRNVDDIIKNEDYTAVVATDVPTIIEDKWSFVNEEGNGIIFCGLSIPLGDNNATFTVKIIFS